MNRWLLLLVAMLVIACQRQLNPANNESVFASIVNTGNGSSVVNNAIKRTVVVSSVTGFCTGFILKTDLILTAGHCIPGSVAKNTVYVNGQVAQPLKSVKNSELDLALLKTDTDKFPLIRFGKPFLGQRVVMVANQDVFRSVTLFGEIIHIQDGFIMTNIASIPGSSGAAVVSLEDGSLLGIHFKYPYAYVNNPKETYKSISGFAVREKNIVKFLLENGK